MAVEPRRAREREDVRTSLVEAARELLEQDGYDALTIRRVAERAEYGLGTVYSYFADKDDLLYSIVQDDYARLKARLLAARDANGGAAAVRAMLLGYVAHGLERPQTYEIMFMLRPRLASRSVEDDGDEHLYPAFRRCVARAIELGEFRSADPNVVAQMLWSAVHGLVSLRVTLPDFAWAEPARVAEELVDSVIRGLAPRTR